jgi:multiple sugar transport system substrate-binding protein
MVPGLLMWYNRQIFRDVGLDPVNFPDTMDTFVDAANKIRDAGHYAYHTGANGPPRYFRRAWYMYFCEQGGELFDENYTRATFNNEEGLRALQFMVDMIHEYEWNVVGSDGYKQFKAGDLGILLARDWFVAAALDSDINWAGARVPIFFEKRYTWANVTSYMIPKQPKGTPERVYADCIEHINYYNDNFWKRTMNAGHLAAYKPSREHPEIRKSEYWKRAGKYLAEMYDTGAAHYPVEHPKGSELENAIQSNIELAVKGEISPQEALTRAEKECNSILKK